MKEIRTNSSILKQSTDFCDDRNRQGRFQEVSLAGSPSGSLAYSRRGMCRPKPKLFDGSYTLYRWQIRASDRFTFPVTFPTVYSKCLLINLEIRCFQRPIRKKWIAFRILFDINVFIRYQRDCKETQMYNANHSLHSSFIYIWQPFPQSHFDDKQHQVQPSIKFQSSILVHLYALTLT